MYDCNDSISEHVWYSGELEGTMVGVLFFKRVLCPFARQGVYKPFARHDRWRYWPWVHALNVNGNRTHWNLQNKPLKI